MITVGCVILVDVSGNIYQYNTPYTTSKNDTYYELVKETFQGLTTCQAMMGQNYYALVNIVIGAKLTIPIYVLVQLKIRQQEGSPLCWFSW